MADTVSSVIPKAFSDRSSRAGMHRNWELGMVAAILCLATGLRLYGIRSESLMGDEFASFKHIGANSLIDYLGQSRQSDPTLSPVYFSLCYLWAHTIDTTVLTARLLSVIFGVATVGIVYALTRTLCDSVTAVFASVMLALSTHHIYFSQEIRMYSLMWFEVALSSLALVKALSSPHRTGWLCVNILVNTALVWTHWFGALFLASQACFLVVLRMGRSSERLLWFAAQAAACVGLGLYILTVDFQSLAGFAAWISPVHWWEALWTPVQLLGLNELGQNRSQPPVTWFGAVQPILPMALIAGLALGIARRYGFQRPTLELGTPTALSSQARFLFLLLWALLPIFLLGLLSKLGLRCFVPRYVGYSTIPLLILLAMSLRAWTLSPRRVLAAVLVLLVFGLFVYRFVSLRRPIETDFPAIAELFGRQLQPRDKILMVPGWQGDVLQYYFPISDTRIENAAEETAVKSFVDKTTNEGGTVWVVVIAGQTVLLESRRVLVSRAIDDNRYRVTTYLIPAYYEAYVMHVETRS